MAVDFLIIIPPSSGKKNGIYPPYGAMYVASALRRKGYNPAILNVDAERITNRDVVRRVKELNPRYLGFSGIVAPSYAYIKSLSFDLKKAFPAKIQILGGGLSSAAETVLKNTAIDIVIRGEGDITATELMDCLNGKRDFHTVRGIHFREGESILFTGERMLIAQLDSLPYPAFDLVDMSKYIVNGAEHIKLFSTKIDDRRIFDKDRMPNMVVVPTSRGCFNECSFCFRSYPGLRVHSIKYVFDFIEYCIEKFNAGFITLGDECFAPTKKRNWEFIEEYKRRRLDIVFKIFGMRVDTVDQDILKAYKEIGCWMIEYGFESGSQKMLNIINKRVSVEDNKCAAVWTRQAGIYTSPAFVLGMPGETTETVLETIDFLKSLDFDFKQYQWKYAIPIPGSELYNFARLTGTIDDEDKYLSSLTGEAASTGFNINLTDEPDEVVAGWDRQLKGELDRHYFYKRYKIENRLLAKIMHIFIILALYKRQKRLFSAVKEKFEAFFFALLKHDRKSPIGAKPIRFRKKINIDIKKLIGKHDRYSINSDMSLRNINRKLREMLANNEVIGR
ncbi:MAG: B12-binding domain-containing radical SAM protein [Omnitrophica bacterium]|nr:B12-binding domain-containing radical SAM protein [Candidatus Omnitrophota bacterium]